MSTTDSQWLDLERPDCSDKALRQLNDSIDHLDKAQREITGYRRDGKGSHLRMVQSQLRKFKELHLKLRKVKLPDFGEKTVKANRAWYKDLASVYNVLLRRERYRRSFSGEGETEIYSFTPD